jgi:hypothetical protein
MDTIPNLPIKRWVFGLHTVGLTTGSEWLYFCSVHSFDTHNEAVHYLQNNRDWCAPDAHPHSGICELSDEELIFYNDYYTSYEPTR